MPSRARLTLAAAVALSGCGGAPDATWRVPPTYADAPAPISAAPASGADVASSAQAAALAAPAGLPPEAAAASGPVGTAGGSNAPVGYDRVGYASWYGEELGGQPTASGEPFQPGAATAAHRTLPLGSYAEVTALDTGRTILVLINDRGPGRADREIDLSRGAAQALGISDRPVAGVRVRAATPSPGDAAALRSGQLASPRMDTPEPVLRALRRQLPAASAGAASARSPVRTAAPKAARPGSGSTTPSAGASYAAPGAPPRTPPPSASTGRARPAAPVAAEPRAAPHGGFVVQVAAFSSEERARNLARSLRGTVSGDGGLWRVRLGPFRDMAAAQAARDGAVRRGYGDAAILIAP